MRIAVVCNDTRGGVEPYAALADGLARAGHTVIAVAPDAYRSLFSDRGLDVVALAGFADEDIGKAVSEAQRGTLAAMTVVVANDLRGAMIFQCWIPSVKSTSAA